MANLNTVLLIDDDPTQIAILTAYFGSLNVETILSCNDAQDACQTVLDQGDTIDLIVSDLSMPKMDGLEFLHFLSENSFVGSVVMISSFDLQILSNASKIGDLHGLNMGGVIKKPLTKKALDQVFSKQVPLKPVASEVKIEMLSKDDLMFALDNGNIIPFYQPKIDLLTGKVIGAEALARWQKSDGTILSPIKFIPLAEEFDLMSDLTYCILNRVVADISNYREDWDGKKIAVNMPPSLLADTSVPNRVRQILDQAGVSSAAICFEVTENGITEFDPRTIEVMTRLKLAGFDLSVDDFGTGASNISNLRAFPYSELKIDQSFINNIDTDAFSAETVRSAISLARQLDMRIVAEGVESKEVLDIIKAKGIDHAQGYFVSPPIEAAAIMDFFKNNHSWMAGKSAQVSRISSAAKVA